MTARLIAILFFCALAAASPRAAHADEYKNALLAIQKSDWIRARGLLTPLAEAGHSGAMFSIGLMYQMGRGVDKDLDKAMKYYQDAAAKGFAPAENNIGVMYKLGIGRPVDYAEAAKWFIKAAPSHTMAKFNLADMYDNGYGVPQDDAKAAQLYIKCAAEGAPPCMYFAGRFLESGRGVPKDLAKAKAYFYQAAEHGYVLAERKVRMLEAAEERKSGKKSAKPAPQKGGK